MKIFTVLILLLGFMIMVSCKGRKHIVQDVHIIDADIKETYIEIIDKKTIEGYLLGVSWEKNEIYVDSLVPVDNKCITRVIDPQTGKNKTKVGFPLGDPQSPSLFTNPSYIEYLDGKYYVFDHLYKIVVYDNNFNYLDTGMFYNRRNFVDFYTYNNGVYFLFGKATNLGENFRYNIERYRLPKGKKPELIQDLYETCHESPYPRNGAKYYYIIYFRSSNWGFEKDGNIFYADNRENKYYRYSLASNKTGAFEMVYLQAKKFSQEEAESAAHYKNSDITVKGLKTVIVPGAEACYHQGLYDVGKEKVGIAADINVKNFTFRLDIFDSRTGQYRTSIRLPLGEGFLRRTSSRNLGYLHIYINVDLGLYIWPDLAGDPQEGAVQVTRFNLKTGSTAPGIE
jgi:hypothetical protein